ncbi:MAG: pseudouridine synthase, partial [Pseudomonadota bacterium]
MSEKLQKYLANLGCGSRREIETWIAAGRIVVDGQIATIGLRVEPNTDILLDGRPVVKKVREQRQVLLYHKPVGQICTRDDPEGRTTVFSRLPACPNGRWIAVGRLDVMTSGLLILTNDGELANFLMQPCQNVPRVYQVRVRGTPTQSDLNRLKQGIMLDGQLAHCREATIVSAQASNTCLSLVLTEGKYREIRRMMKAIDLSVNRLKRV